MKLKKKENRFYLIDIKEQPSFLDDMPCIVRMDRLNLYFLSLLLITLYLTIIYILFFVDSNGLSWVERIIIAVFSTIWFVWLTWVFLQQKRIVLAANKKGFCYQTKKHYVFISWVEIDDISGAYVDDCYGLRIVTFFSKDVMLPKPLNAVVCNKFNFQNFIFFQDTINYKKLVNELNNLRIKISN